MISILTYSPKFLSKEKIKFWIKKIINRYRGPEIVLNNLVIGLKRQNYNFLVNKISPTTNKLHVISGIETLKWAIKEKEAGRISELIVGPNLVNVPKDFDSIITNKNIDKILLPSEWTADVYSTLAPEIKDKIYMWPAGTECNIEINDKKNTNKCLIFKKQVDEALFENIKKYLKDNKIEYDIIEYGKYTIKQYFDKLNESKYVIYLQESESQGMALQEAWAHNVPTFVWDKGYILYEDKNFPGKIAAPYLTDENGEFFKDFEELKNKLPGFIKKLNTFKPREYCVNNLSIKKSTEIYINIVEGKAEKWSYKQ